MMVNIECFRFLSSLFSLFFNIKRWLESKEAISYGVKSKSIVQKDTNILKDSLDINFFGEETENIYFSRVVLWNNGYKTIKKDDFVRKNPLKIELKECGKILQYEVVKVSNVFNDFTFNVSDDKNVINLDFDFIKQNDGFVLDVYYSSNSADNIDLSGTLRNSDNFKNVFREYKLKYKWCKLFDVSKLSAKKIKTKEKVNLSLIFFFVFFLTLKSLYSLWYNVFHPYSFVDDSFALSMIGVVGCGLLSCAYFLILFKPSVPDTLEEFCDEIRYS